MKAKTIRKVLRTKIDEWLKTIDDEELRKDLKSNVIVTGGAIASMLLREPVNDYDVYLRTKEMTKRVAEYYVSKFKLPKFKDDADKGGISITVTEDGDRIKIGVRSAGIASAEGDEGYQYFEGLDDAQSIETAEYVEQATAGISIDSPAGQAAINQSKGKYAPVFLSSNAITLTDQLQIVVRFYGEPEEIHRNYDFVHCTNYWTSWNNHLELRPKALECLLTKELVYVGSLYPLASIIRTRKFLRREWSINAGQYLKMAVQLSQLDLLNYKVLEEQLIGVDAAYFVEVIQELKDVDPEKIDTSYLMEVVDKIF